MRTTVEKVTEDIEQEDPTSLNRVSTEITRDLRLVTNFLYRVIENRSDLSEDFLEKLGIADTWVEERTCYGFDHSSRYSNKYGKNHKDPVSAIRYHKKVAEELAAVAD